MSTFEQESASLEQILQQEILVGIEPPYEDQAKLSQVALRMRKSQSLKSFVFESVILGINSVSFALLYLREAKPYSKNSFKNVDFLKTLCRYFQTNDEHHYFVADISLSCMHNPKAESERLRLFVEILHGPTKNTLPGRPILKYISPAEAIHILPERVKEMTAGNQLYNDPKMTEYLMSFFYPKILRAIRRQPSILDLPEYTFCNKIRLDESTNLFLKWVDPTRVSAVDHEINIANELQQQGINVPTFYGYTLSGDNAHLIAEAVEGVDFLRIRYVDDLYLLVKGGNPLDERVHIDPFIHLLKSSFKQKITFPFLKEKVAEAYLELGREVRKAVEAGLMYPDAALRNSMLTYEKGKPKVTLIDFEQATMVDTVTDGIRGATIGTIGTQLASASLESKYLYKGFWNK